MRTHDPEGSQPSGRPVWLGLTLLLGLVLGGWLWSTSERHALTPDASPAADSRQTAEAPGAARPVQPGQARTLSRPADFVLRQGEEVAVAAVTLSDDWPSVLQLSLSEEHTLDFGIESAWLYREGREPLEIQVTRTGPASVRTELPPGTLVPGRAILELRTDEISPLPLRRFALRIR